MRSRQSLGNRPVIPDFVAEFPQHHGRASLRIGRLVTALASCFLTALLLGASASRTTVSEAATAEDRQVPLYKHIFVIVEENKDAEMIVGSANAPALTRLAREYGYASRFFGEVHPSESNYIALLAGSTFGIHDDDAFYCKPGVVQAFCPNAGDQYYVDHTVEGAHLGTQLTRAGLSWKGYYESIPEPGSLAVVGDSAGSTLPLYAAKHSGFVNFANVRTDPRRREHLADFRDLERDRVNGALPNFALIVPNQCNDMHGLWGGDVPPDCSGDEGSLVRRGDAYAERLIRELMTTAAWQSSANVAIIVTFDESTARSRGGCCGYDPASAANYGGGHIATIVMTNHGPRGVRDATPYNHYSLLRTMEDAFGIHSYLNLAGATSAGVRPMTPLFRRR